MTIQDLAEQCQAISEDALSIGLLLNDIAMSLDPDAPVLNQRDVDQLGARLQGIRERLSRLGDTIQEAHAKRPQPVPEPSAADYY